MHTKRMGRVFCLLLHGKSDSLGKGGRGSLMTGIGYPCKDLRTKKLVSARTMTKRWGVRNDS